MTTVSEIEKISPDKTLEAYARQVIVSYFREMMSYKEGAEDGTDIAFVHEMRVTSRRLRAAMDNFVDCFPKKPFRKHYKRIKAITQTMGAVRDLDVLIARFQRELNTLPKMERSDIQGLIEHLHQKRKEVRKPMRMLFEELEETDFETEFLAFFVGEVCNPDS